MSAITEDYVSFETAKLLKDKGFNEPCLYYYFSDGIIGRRKGLKDRNCPSVNTFSMPTYQMAMKWLREVHKIYIDTNIRIILEQWAGYDINIYTTKTNDCLLDKVISLKGLKDNTFYEDACEAAIKYCLENLI